MIRWKINTQSIVNKVVEEVNYGVNSGKKELYIFNIKLWSKEYIEESKISDAELAKIEKTTKRLKLGYGKE